MAPVVPKSVTTATATATATVDTMGTTQWASFFGSAGPDSLEYKSLKNWRHQPSSAVVLREFCIAVFNKPCDVAIIKSGMDHKPSFACTVTWPVKGSVGTGTAGSKKEAEKRAYDQLACVLEEKARFILLNETHTSPAPAHAPAPAPAPPAAACASFSSTAALHEFMKANRIVMTLETFGTGFRATCACYAVENIIKVLAYGKDIASVTEESLAKMRLELEQLKVLQSQFDVK